MNRKVFCGKPLISFGVFWHDMNGTLSRSGRAAAVIQVSTKDTFRCSVSGQVGHILPVVKDPDSVIVVEGGH